MRLLVALGQDVEMVVKGEAAVLSRPHRRLSGLMQKSVNFARRAALAFGALVLEVVTIPKPDGSGDETRTPSSNAPRRTWDALRESTTDV